METDGRILIVGGGIAGLTLANALASRGIAFELIERAPRWEPLGAGIGLGPNAMTLLRRLGRAEQIEREGWRFDRGVLADTRGRTLSVHALSTPEHGPLHGFAVPRSILHEALLEGVAGRALRLGLTVDAFAPDTRDVRVRFSDGSHGIYTRVIGADGIRSRVRDLAFGVIAPRYAGYTSWRFLATSREPPPFTIELWGCGRRVGVVPLGGDRVYVYATLNRRRGHPDPLAGRADCFREQFKDFAGPVPAALAGLERDAQLIATDIEEIQLPRWSSGRIALIGDAAHAMTPNLGQGAAMAIEDAWVLAESLEATPDGAAFEAWEQRRRPRVTRIQRLSRVIGSIGQISWPLGCAVRDFLLRRLPAPTRKLSRLLAELP
jgi:2-polyprenyl-6-methoxyphenol hydroxylase-like FAD-dependent oxidoreductase